MISELPEFALRLRKKVLHASPADWHSNFPSLSLELFNLQFEHNPAYRRLCDSRGMAAETLADWTQIPAIPTAAFKELELSCIPPEARSRVFHSSGTTEQRPSRHFHNADSLETYHASLWSWFRGNILAPHSAQEQSPRLLILAPNPESSPHSSLVEMFDIIRQQLAVPESAFAARLDRHGDWVPDFDQIISELRSAATSSRPTLILGTAFAFVHLIDHLAAQRLEFKLPPQSIAMETGGYKGRSRAVPKDELHQLMTRRLGIAAANIRCEYGMSELSSQAYDTPIDTTRVFHFPPWARVQIVSPETGREVADGETGLIRVFDLANVFSVMAVQTEDLAVRRGDGFELLGRATSAEPRGCSLMTP